MFDYGGPISGAAVWAGGGGGLLFAVTDDVPGWAELAVAAIRSMETLPGAAAAFRGALVTSYGPPSDPWTRDVAWLQLRVHCIDDSESGCYGRPASMAEAAEFLATVQPDMAHRYSFWPARCCEEAPRANPGYVGAPPSSLSGWSPTGVCFSVVREFGTPYRLAGGSFCAHWPHHRGVALLVTDVVPDWKRYAAAASVLPAGSTVHMSMDTCIGGMWVAGGRAHDRRSLGLGSN